MYALFSKIILLSLMRAACSFILPRGAAAQCTDALMRLLTVMSLMDSIRTLMEGAGL